MDLFSFFTIGFFSFTMAVLFSFLARERVGVLSWRGLTESRLEAALFLIASFSRIAFHGTSL